jgi:hypothetical protein
MRPTRGATLAGLVFIAVAAPIAAYAFVDNTDAPGLPSPAATHGQGDDQTGDNAEHTTGAEHANEASAPGRAHAEAMKAWARCVAEAASGPKSGERTGPPKDECGDKPVAPGRAAHADDESSTPGKADKHKAKTHGRSGEHRH